MKNIKLMKKHSKKIVKSHYIILVMACLMSAIIGNEFSSSINLNETVNVISQIKGVPVRLEKTVEEVKEKIEITKTKVSNSMAFSKKRGVFSLIANTFDSNKIYLTIVGTIDSITKSKDITSIILTILSFIFYFLVWFYFINIFSVIIRRIFLEARIYEKVKLEKFLFLQRVKKWTKASFTMFLYSIKLMLWYLTIVGGFIKKYSYMLVPFIVSENPDIKSSDAIKLSSDMMKGHKWEAFLLDLSFIGWEVLGILTLNMSKIFYSNAYYLSVKSEYYANLRLIAIKNNINGIEYLNDKYLYKKANKMILNNTYSDIKNKMKEKNKISDRTHLRGFIDKYFGITTYSKKDNELFDREQNRIAVISLYQDIMDQKVYPELLYPIKIKQRNNHIETINYLRHYSISSLILIFFILSFVGWLWEVLLHLVSDGIFVNRGVLHGPWLPIYGFGSILILTLLYRFRSKPYLLFFMSVILCGVVEYSTSYYLEVTNGMKWWDYTGYFLNINGRVCAEGLLVFGIGSIFVVYFVAPLLDNYIKKIKTEYVIYFCIILCSIYLIDLVISYYKPNTGVGITDYKSVNNNKEKSLINI